jgi:hypothetical protein
MLAGRHPAARQIESGLWSLVLKGSIDRILKNTVNIVRPKQDPVHFRHAWAM